MRKRLYCAFNFTLCYKLLLAMRKTHYRNEETTIQLSSIKNKIMSESKIQSACVKWLWNEHPETRGCFFAVNNNSEHVARAMQRKAIGLVKGVSDTIFLWKSKSYLIEFKTDTGRQSPEQKRWENAVTKQGSQYIIIRSLEEFKKLMSIILKPDC